MLAGSNLKNFLLGGTRGRELRDTRRAWEAAQAAWRASPLGRTTIPDLALAVTKELMAGCRRPPALPILVALAEALEELLRAEDLGDLEPRWAIIETDASAAVEFREIAGRRRRWAIDFANMFDAFRAIVRPALARFFDALPESCFGDAGEAGGEGFEVPLVDLVSDAAQAIDSLFMLPYDDTAFRLEIFARLRELCAGNLLVASGLPRDANPREHAARLVLPPAQKNRTGAELAGLYLAGSPLQRLAEVAVPFHIPEALRFEHCHIVGGTGHGKTQLMQKMIHADLVAAAADGRSVIVIDSQGDLINKLMRLELFAPGRPLAERLVLVDPADVEHPVSLNLFDAPVARLARYTPADRERVLNGVVELYETFFGAFLGAELTQKQGVIFKYLARLMLAIPGATIHTLMRIMEDGRPFRPHMEALDGSARHFFATEFFHPSFAATRKQILRRLWGVLATPAFERMFAQAKNRIDLYEAMNTGKIVLVSTAKDLLKREGSELLGRFFIAMITQAALERATIPERQRKPVFLYVDEAQEYFDENIETILNQARKYRVSLSLAHQTLDQLTPRLRSAILANTSFKCAGGVSAKDARALADELHTTPAFIEGMARHGDRSEFAIWVKHLTGRAIRLAVPLGFLERQPTLAEEDLDALLAANRGRYCGTLADVAHHAPEAPRMDDGSDPSEFRARPAPAPAKPAAPTAADRRDAEPRRPDDDAEPLPFRPARAARPPVEERELGKGGARHRYLQALVKELAEQHGLRATLEAPLAAGGQVDVLLERDGVVAAVEISVTTPAAHEKANLRKCLAAGHPLVAIVLAKSRISRTSCRAALEEDLAEGDRERVRFLAPEDLPDFIGSLAAPPDPEERIVRGYRVKGSFTRTSAEEARARRDAVARLIAKSLAQQKRD